MVITLNAEFPPVNHKNNLTVAKMPFIVPTMNSEKTKRMDEVVALKRRIKKLKMTVGHVCEKCHVHRSTFSAWGAGRARQSKKWDRVMSFVQDKEKACQPSPE